MIRENNLIKADIVTHSKRLNTNEELITYKLIYPRIIHSELMTYHMMSVNSASSRAIPVNKLIEVIEESPFYPISYQKKHSGMQGSSYFTSEEDIKTCDSLWKESMQESIKVAKKMLDFGMSKQVINRGLESYQYHCCLITGTRESFEHLFEQRCPQYEFEVDEGEFMTFKSKKEFIETYNCYKDKSDLWWLQHNKGQAEIHFMDLSEKMYDALNESTPVLMKEDEWHIPFSDRPEFTPEMSLKDKIMLSCAMTARTSYTVISDNEILTLEKAKRIYDKCVEQGHFSVVSHCAKCMTGDERNTWIKGELKQVAFSEFDSETFLEAPEEAKGFCKNIRGYIPLRQYVEDGVELSNFK